MKREYALQILNKVKGGVGFEKWNILHISRLFALDLLVMLGGGRHVIVVLHVRGGAELAVHRGVDDRRLALRHRVGARDLKMSSFFFSISTISFL